MSPTERRDSTDPVFDKDAYRRFRLPKSLGEVISGWDDPAMTSAERADHMRDDDYVIGVIVEGRARAYPLWVLDNYHLVNDRVGQTLFIVTSCERCQSGSAFVRDVPGPSGRDQLFRSVGFLDATLVLKDTRSRSHWIHWEGLAIDRGARGTRLPWIQTLHMEWRDWVQLHPETEVMLPPADATHPDARHGHGREEFFSRPGMDPAFLSSITGPLDETYPENETVLVIEGRRGWSAFPLREVQRSRGVVHAAVDGAPVVVLAGPRPDGFTMASYDPRVADRRLTFERGPDGYSDRETASRWSIEGVALSGPLEGGRLEPVRSFQLRWHAFVYCHRNVALWRSPDEPAPFGAHDAAIVGPFERALSTLAAGGHEIEVEGPVVSQRRPRDSAASLETRIDGHRINLHSMRSEASARDYEAFEGAVSGWPMRERALEFRTRRVGTLVVESDPEVRFADPAQIVRLPHRSVAWSPLLDSPDLDELTPPAAGEQPSAPGFSDLIRALRAGGLEVLEVGFLPPGQLRPGCENAIALTIDAERFLLYRFWSADLADRYAASEPHALVVDRFVIRSTPDTMYAHQAYEIAYVGHEWIRWSPLLSDPRLTAALRSAIGSDAQRTKRPARDSSDALAQTRHA